MASLHTSPTHELPSEKKSRERPTLHSLFFSEQAYDSLQLAKLFALAYAPFLVVFVLLTSLFLVVSAFGWDAIYKQLWGSPRVRAHVLLITAVCLPTLCLLYVRMRSPPCYLVDFASFKSLDDYKLSTECCVELTRACGKFTLKNLLFQLKVLLKSGLGEETYGVPALFSEDKTPTYAASRIEADLMMFGALDELLLKTGLLPVQIDFLIVNMSLFYPAPSLSSHLVNHYKMRADVKTFNISGMGCAAGMVAVDLAKDILRVHKNKYVVIVGSENITLNWYYGNDRSMLVPNCLFRCGSYALLLSNRSADKARSKFELVQSVRTTTAARDASYNVIVTREDDEGVVGTALSMELLDVASDAITISMSKLVPFNMPFSELLKILVNTIQRTVLKKDVKPYLPDFKKAFKHFCLHPGGKAVVEGVGKTLRLSDYDMEPGKMALHRFGNTSSSGLWYALAYCEAKERLKKGDKVWQVSLGSGFKCNSVVWRVLRDVKPQKGFNPWMDCIDRYPVEVPDIIPPTHKYYPVIKMLERMIKEAAASKQQA